MPEPNNPNTVNDLLTPKATSDLDTTVVKLGDVVTKLTKYAETSSKAPRMSRAVSATNITRRASEGYAYKSLVADAALLKKDKANKHAELTAYGRSLTGMKSAKDLVSHAISGKALWQGAGPGSPNGGSKGQFFSDIGSGIMGALKVSGATLALQGLAMAAKGVYSTFIDLKGRVQQHRDLIAGGAVSASAMYGRGASGYYESARKLDAVNTYIKKSAYGYGLDQKDIGGGMAMGLRSPGAAVTAGVMAKALGAGYQTIAKSMLIATRRFADVTPDHLLQVNDASDQLGITVDENSAAFQSLTKSIQGMGHGQLLTRMAANAAALEAKGMVRSGDVNEFANMGRGSMSSMIGMVAMLRRYKVGGYGTQSLTEEFERFRKNPAANIPNISALGQQIYSKNSPIAAGALAEWMGTSATDILTWAEKGSAYTRGLPKSDLTVDQMKSSIAAQATTEGALSAFKVGFAQLMPVTKIQADAAVDSLKVLRTIERKLGTFTVEKG